MAVKITGKKRDAQVEQILLDPKAYFFHGIAFNIDRDTWPDPNIRWAELAYRLDGVMMKRDGFLRVIGDGAGARGRDVNDRDRWVARGQLLFEPNEDLTVWTCALREGVTFHDGSTFDSNDVVMSWAVGLDAANPYQIGTTGTFEYFSYLWDGLMNAPAVEEE